MSRLGNAWRALRGRDERKASATGSLVVVSNAGRAVPHAIDAAKFAQEGFVENVIAFRAVSDIAQSIASCAWLAYLGDKQIENAAHPLVRLLARANPGQSFTAFIEQLAAFRVLAGNAYAERVIAGGTARELYALRPDRMKVVPGNLGVPAAYVYEVSGQTRRFDSDPITGDCDIVHMRSFHPLNDFYGLAPLQPAATSIDQHNASGVWNSSLLANGAKKDFAFTVAPNGDGSFPVLDHMQRTQLLKAIDEKMAGPRNAGGAVVLDGGLKPEALSMSPRDMDWLQGRFAAARDVAIAFGYPPMLLGIPGDNTYSNQKEARQALWETVVIPLAESIADALNAWLAQVSADESRIVIDTDAVPALSERRSIVWTRVQTADFLTPNEKRAAVGYDPVDGGDSLLVPAGLLPIDFAPPDASAPKHERARWYKSLGYDDAEADGLADLESAKVQ